MLQITWLHNDKPVKRSKDIEMVTDCGRCSLIIHEVYLEDAGQYVCAGTNEHGTAQTSCQLSVERTYRHGRQSYRETRGGGPTSPVIC